MRSSPSGPHCAIIVAIAFGFPMSVLGQFAKLVSWCMCVYEGGDDVGAGDEDVAVADVVPVTMTM